MPQPVFEYTFLLQSLGWAIVNSFWQIGILWLLYKFITGIDKKLPALVKHHLSITLLIISLIWFIFTIQQNYLLLSNQELRSGTLVPRLWLPGSQFFNDVLPVLSIVYLVLLCRYTAKFFKSLSANRFLKGSGLAKAPLDIRLFTAKTALHLGIKRKIRVWLSEHVEVPSVTGFIKPVILLPAAIINQLSIQQTEAILLHELAHIKRNDYLVNLVQSVVEVILFFNPFALLLSKAAKKERENCCDDWVMNFQYDQYEYAQALLVLEEQRLGSQFTFALAATNGKKNLLQRIQRLFNNTPQTGFSALQKINLICVCLLSLTLVFLLLPFVPGKRQDDLASGDTKAKLNLVAITNGPKENIQQAFIIPPVKPVKNRELATTGTKPKKQVLKKATKEYVNALVNEELMNPTSPVEAIINQVVEKEIKVSKYLVKIEEQQSGLKQTNTYYFELNNSNGNTAIRPLIILNKIRLPLANVLGSLNDSLNTLKKVKKKRTTS